VNGVIREAKRSYRAVSGTPMVQQGEKHQCNFYGMTRFVGQCLLVISGAVIASIAGCDRSTARLPAAQERQFQNEGIRRRADDVIFRWTRDPGGRDERREDRRASIVVTSSSLLIHKNAKVGLQLTPRTRKATTVERSGDRIRIRSGRGRSEEIWSFEAPEDAPGWATDIRNVINSLESGRRD
jgi:hypothetical protein